MVIEGDLEITVDGVSKVLQAGGVAHVPASIVHSLRNVTETHLLTVTTKGRATRFFTRVSDEVEMSPPDLPGILRVATENDIQFEL